MAAHVYLMLLLIILKNVYCQEYNRGDGLIDRLSNGMKFAKDYLGSDSVALKVAEFVVRAFQNPGPQTVENQKPYKESYVDRDSEAYPQAPHPNFTVGDPPNPWSPLKHLVKLFGLQPNQISAVAVNALVFVAQMISTFLTGPKRPSATYRSDDFDPSAWILNRNSRTLQDLISMAKNESLADVIENIIKDQDSKEETGCIRLLVCKVTPFVTKMQRVVFGGENGGDSDKKEGMRGAAAMYRHLPATDELLERSNYCEQRHRDCDLNE